MRSRLIVLALVVACGAPAASAPPHVEAPIATVSAPPMQSLPPVKTPRIVFEGNTNVASSELWKVTLLDKEDPTEDLLARDIMYLDAAYYDRGYVEVKIVPEVRRARDGRILEARMHIDEGARYRVGKITIAERDDKGAEVEPLGGRAKLRGRITLNDGDFFARNVLVDDITAIRLLYRDAGYASVDTDPTTSPDPPNATIDIDIPIRRHAPTYVDRIVITGNHRVDTAAIEKQLVVKKGSLFNETKLIESKKKLEGLGSFTRVDIVTEAKPSTTRWTVTFEVSEK
jgi:outer membrane protein insertion porin family